MKINLLFLVFGFLLPCFGLHGQQWDFKGNANSAVVSFDMANHIILLPVRLNGEALTFILDTGVKETLLFGAVDSTLLNNVSSVNFQGLGVSQGIKGLLSLGNVLAIGDSALVDRSHDLFVIVDSTINLSKNIGVPIHGILGSNFFQNHVVRIDYAKKRIYVFKSLDNIGKELRKYVPVKLELVKDRPFINVDLYTVKKDFKQVRMLVDLGNSDPLLIFPTELKDYEISDPYVYEFLGQGFNGNIYGKRNRIPRVDLQGFGFDKPFVSHPDADSYRNRKLVERRSGSVGNQIMSRFDIIFNYADSMMYLRRNRNFMQPFNIDMSGLEVRHSGFTWLKSRVSNTPIAKSTEQGVTINLSSDVTYQIELVPSYIIQHVRTGSPAYLAGVKEGDMIHKINGKYAGKMTLESIRNKLQAKDRYGVSLEVEREEAILRFNFRLVDPIPLHSP